MSSLANFPDRNISSGRSTAPDERHSDRYRSLSSSRNHFTARDDEDVELLVGEEEGRFRYQNDSE